MTALPSIRIEGGLLGPEVLDQVLAGDLPGQKPADFRLDPRRNLTDEIAAVFADARALWGVFKNRLARLSENDTATSVTRDAWVIPLFGLLGYELRYNSRAHDVDGLTFAVSHRAGDSEEAPPAHIVGARQELGRLPPSGRPRLSPHALVQEYLNHTEHLWGIVTNGLTLRLLRDSALLRREAYVEFDLQAIFEEQRFPDFVAFYRLLHRTRLPRGTTDAHECLLEKYHAQTIEQGGRVREHLRDGVEKCLRLLGDAFLAHPANNTLRQKIRDKELLPAQFYRQLLRLVYRFLFLLVSEDRGLISPNHVYRDHYGVGRLRRLLDRCASWTDHTDLWLSLRTLFQLFRDDRLAAILDLAPLNGELFENQTLDDCLITNRDLLGAFWQLAYYKDSPSTPPRRVNYAALDVEELGSVYESLLEFHPHFDTSKAIPAFDFLAGSERKTTGSYYTPPELVNELIESALVPVIRERLDEAKRIARGEWRTVEEPLQNVFREYANQRLSRLDGLEARSGESGTPTDPRRGPGLSATGGGGRPASGDSRAGQQASQSGTQPGASSATVERLWRETPVAVRHLLFAEHALLSVRILDPACGSGHMLLAAARRLGKELARIRTGEDEPAPERVREAVRDVITHCIYGVDKNPLAVDLCRVALWLESHTAGKPLTFLDHRIRCGDSLVGVLDLDVLAQGIPDKAFDPCEGDDKTAARAAGKNNKQERGGALQDLFVLRDSGDVEVITRHSRELDGIPDDSPALIRRKKQIFDGSHRDPAWQRQKQACDLWTAAFFQNLRLAYSEQRIANGQKSPASDSPFALRDSPSTTHHPPLITTAALADHIVGRPIDAGLLKKADDQAGALNFFHWPLEFPEVFERRAVSSEQRAANSEKDVPLAAGRSPLANFAAGRSPLAQTSGFDVILSNPPWERIKLQEQEFFAARDPQIASAPNKAERAKLIKELPQKNPGLHAEFTAAVHAADCASKFLRHSARCPLTARGDINTYAVFAETIRRLLSPTGRAGVILPTGIATDATCQDFFADLNQQGRLVSLFDFENRDAVFPAVHRSYKFCLLTLCGSEAGELGRSGNRRSHAVETKDTVGDRPSKKSDLADHPRTDPAGSRAADFAFFLTRAEHLRDPRRRFRLSADDLALFNPNTRTCPVFRTRADADLTRAIYQRVPVLVREGQPNGNPWGIRFMQGLFNMTSDSHLFCTREQLEQDGFRLVGNVFVKGDPRSHSAIRYSPLYEAKLMHQFDHRFATYEGERMANGEWRMETRETTSEEKGAPTFVIQSRYWVAEAEVYARLRCYCGDVVDGPPTDVAGYETGGHMLRWLLGFRDITNATNERTAIFSFLPMVGVGHTMPLVFTNHRPELELCVCANLNTVVLDFVARQKIGGTHLTYNYLNQLPVLPPSFYTAEALAFVVPRVLELVYTAEDMRPLADAILAQIGVEGWNSWFPHKPVSVSSPSTLPSPFIWNEERRALLRAELDAWYARAYGLTRKQLRYILDPADLTRRELQNILDPWEEVTDPLDPAGYEARCKSSDWPGETFRVLKEKELTKFGEYRTRRLVLEAWARLT